MTQASKILIKPVITEKSNVLSEKLNQYTFIVDRESNKVEIRKAVEEMYGVSVTKVNTSVIPGKMKVRYSKSGVSKGKTSAIKKAIVSIAQGDTIDFFSNI